MANAIYLTRGGHYEVFYVPENDGPQPLLPGWYWQRCVNGEWSDPCGPFLAEQDVNSALVNVEEVG